MRLAYISPLPPQRSGIADYSAALLPYLRPYCERLVGVVEAGIKPVLSSGVFDAVYDASDPSWWAAERVIPLYHMGNNGTYHRYIYNLLQRFPGITVLHDGGLLPFINAVTLESGARAAFVRELSFAEGSGSTALAWQHLRGAATLSLEEHPMLARVCRASLGVIVHSDYVRARVVEAFPQVRVAVIPHLDVTLPETGYESPSGAKKALGYAQTDLLIGVFGFMASGKRLESVLEAFQRLHMRVSNVYLVCVGEVVPGYEVKQQLSGLGLQDLVRLTGYVSLEQFQRYVNAVDVGVNLRYPTWGETSGPLLRLMAAGKPVVVTNAGSFAEMPDTAVIKVPYNNTELEALVTALDNLLTDDAMRNRMGAYARQYVAQHCAPQKIGRRYANFIESTLKSFRIDHIQA